MKKNMWIIPGKWENLIITLKLIVILLISTFSVSGARSYAQETKLTLNSEKISIKDLFNQIERSSEYIFVYYDNIADLDKEISIKVENQTIDKILNKVLASTDNSFKIFDRQIVITKKVKAVDAPTPSPVLEQQVQKRELRGTVKDDKGITLPGVTVIVKGSTVGAITDTDGNFTISVPLSAKVLVFSFV